MRTRLALFLIMLLATVVASAQEEQDVPTELHRFLAKKGTLIVKTFHSHGTIEGQYGTGAKVESILFYEAGNKENGERGIAIEVIQDRNRKSTSFLDLDEAESMADALKYMEEAISTLEVGELDYTEVFYRTRDGFRVGFFKADDGNRGCFMKSGTSQASFSESELKKVRLAVRAGLAHLALN